MANEFNVLVVEDDEKTFKVLKDGLRGTVYKIWRATTGKEALRLAKEIYFMVVTTEIQIPDMNVIKLIKRIKKIYYKTNIIVLTTYPFTDSALEAMREGAFAYLTKPLNIEEVKLILKRAIENTHLLIQAGRRKYYQDMSILDGLTGVYNHRHFHEMLGWQIAHMRRFSEAFSLFIIDIDDFKTYNDLNGHLAGDKILHTAAQLFVDLTRNGNLVFRYGGEEFTIILPQTSQGHAVRVGERLIEAVRNRLPVTISIGLAAFPGNAQTKTDLINRADKALYRAKALGKDRICVYDERLDKVELA